MAKALELLRASLEPPQHELNELDWKAALSPDKKRLTEHLSAFANLPGGGYLAFGIDGTGKPVGVNQAEIEKITNQLANLGREALEPRLALDHGGETYEGVRLLFVHIPETTVKPVHLRGKGLKDAFIRSGGTARGRIQAGNRHLDAAQPHSTLGRTARVDAAPR